MATHVTIHTNHPTLKVDTEHDLGNCFYDKDPDFDTYEVFVDETMINEEESGYGVYFGENNPLNCHGKVYGKQNLQNATYQGIERVLMTIPCDENITFYIDRESVFKVLKKLPLTPREEHHTSELHIVKKIYAFIILRTGETHFQQVFSHLESTDSNKNPDMQQKHLRKMIDMYGEERAHRLMQGNIGADKEANKAKFDPNVKTPPLGIGHNMLILESTRKKATEKGKTIGYVTEKYREHLKNHIREEKVYNCISKNEQYEEWLENDNVSEITWNLIKTLDHKKKKYKNHMIKILHNTLPTKQKVLKRKIAEQKQQNGTYWKKCYPHIKDNRCVFCKEEVETTDHLSMCRSKYVLKMYDTARQKIAKIAKTKITWFPCTKPSKFESGISLVAGSKGIIPKKVVDIIHKKDSNKKNNSETISKIQKILIKTHLNIWKKQNQIIHGKAKT